MRKAAVSLLCGLVLGVGYAADPGAAPPGSDPPPDDPDQAIAECSMVLELASDDVNAYCRRGIAYTRKSDHDHAIADFTRVIELKPEFEWGYRQRGHAYVEKGEPERAVADLTRAIELKPDSASAHNDLAWILATCPQDAVRNGHAALEHAEKACRLTAWRNGTYLDTLAAVHAELAQYAEAVRWQTQALSDPGSLRDHGSGARARLRLYAAGCPYRERAPSPATAVPERAGAGAAPAGEAPPQVRPGSIGLVRILGRPAGEAVTGTGPEDRGVVYRETVSDIWEQRPAPGEPGLFTIEVSPLLAPLAGAARAVRTPEPQAVAAAAQVMRGALAEADWVGSTAQEIARVARDTGGLDVAFCEATRLTSADFCPSYGVRLAGDHVTEASQPGPALQAYAQRGIERILIVDSRGPHLAERRLWYSGSTSPNPRLFLESTVEFAVADTRTGTYSYLGTATVHSDEARRFIQWADGDGRVFREELQRASARVVDAFAAEVLPALRAPGGAGSGAALGRSLTGVAAP